MNRDVWVLVESIRGEVLEISYTMLAAGRELATARDGKLFALLLGHDARDLAGRLGAADHVIYVDHAALAEFTSEAYQQTITGLLKDAAPRVVLFGHTTVGMDVACDISVELDLPLITSCQTFKIDTDPPGYVSLTCGGKVMAEGSIPEPTCLVTMVPGGYKSEAGQLEGPAEITQVESPPALDQLRVKLRAYIEPESGDVDITKEPILVSVGRGIQQQNNLELAEALAAALNGAVSASRPVVDQGWLPTSRMVGKSGQQVKPRLYLALGISGAPEHIEGVPDFETMVAVNTDEHAPIFDFAQYGATVDVLELIPALTEKIKDVKGN